MAERCDAGAIEEIDAGVVEPTWKADLLPVLGWLLAAAALRFIGLGRFSLWGDEYYSLDNAIDLFSPRMQLGDYAFLPFFMLERLVLEVSGMAHVTAPDPVRLAFLLRLVPAAAGSIAVAAAYRCSRGFLRRGERHALAALLAFSPWFLLFSQMARSYSLLLAFVVPATFELLRAAREGSVRRGVVGTAWALVATITHPTAALLLVGHVAAALVAALMRVRPLSRGLLPPLLMPLVLALPAAIWPGAVRDTLVYKLQAQDAGIESVGALLLGIGWNVGPVVAALALLGLPVLWRRDRVVAVYVVVGVAMPVLVMIGLAMFGTSVEQRYLLAVVPLAMIPAALLIGEIAGQLRECVPRLAVPALALVAYTPGVVSELIDGNRHDLAAAAELVRSRLAVGDGIISETHALMRRYLPADFPADRLLEAPPQTSDPDREQHTSMWKSCPRIWIVIPADFEEHDLTHRSFLRWAWSQGRLVQEIWHPRLDYHQNRLWVFLVEPAHTLKWWPGWQAKG